RYAIGSVNLAEFFVTLDLRDVLPHHRAQPLADHHRAHRRRRDRCTLRGAGSQARARQSADAHRRMRRDRTQPANADPRSDVAGGAQMLDTSLLALWPLIVVGGFGVGFLVGMTGVGAGSLMTPFLITQVGVQPAL